MQPKERIIVALDVPHVIQAQGLVDKLFGKVGGFQLGLAFSNSMQTELLTHPRSEIVNAVLDEYRELFQCLRGVCSYDGKFMDIPDKVAEASCAVTQLGVKMFTVQCLGGFEMMKRAREASEGEAKKRGFSRPLILGITLLTSLDLAAVHRLGIFPFHFDDTCAEAWFSENNPECSGISRAAKEQAAEALQSFVVRLALLAQKAALDGVVASAQECKAIREACGNEFLIVTPSIRASDAPPDDQKRYATAREAVDAGADFLVIGRPIIEAENPQAAVQKFANEIENPSRVDCHGGFISEMSI